MDDKSNDMLTPQSPRQNDGENESSDEEVVQKLKSKKRILDDSDIDDEDLPVTSNDTDSTKKRILDDDSDMEDEDLPGTSNNTDSTKERIQDDESDMEDEDLPGTSNDTNSTKKAMTAAEVLDAVMADDEDQESNEEDGNEREKEKKEDSDCSTESSPKKRKKVRKPVAEDSSDEEESTSLMDTIKKQMGGANDLFDADEAPEKTSTADSDSGSDNDEAKSSRPPVPDNLFNNSDAENSGCESSGSESNKSENEREDDEGIDESQIDPKLLKKLKKGAAKLTPKQKEMRKKKEDVMSLHSETQRMIRESRVNIPYHQPAPKSINDFLARATMKQQQYKALKGIRDSRKAVVVQDLLEKTRIKSRAKTQEEMDKYSDSDEDWNPEMEKEQDGDKPLRERLKDKHDADKSKSHNSETLECSKSDVESMDVENVDNRTSVKNDANENEEQKTCDEETSRNNKHTGDSKSKEESQDSGINSLGLSDGPVGVDSELFKTADDCENMERVDADNTDNEKSLKPFEDVEFDWGMGEESEKTNDSEKVKDEVDKKEEIESSKTRTDDIDSKTNNTENIDPTPKKQKPSPSGKMDNLSNSAIKKRKQLALAGIDLDNIKPCLSGNASDFITLQEEPEKPMNPGVAKLLDRLQKHAVKKEKKHAKDVDISIISKDARGTASVEELKLNTFVYHVEEEEDNPLMKLEAPGAKLVALKEQLQEKIKAKREMARQKRQEAYDFDNEEAGYEEEEEAEMSEHSDTDVDDDEFDKQYSDEEEDIDEEEDVEEEKEKNPFADDEADEDGEEEGEEYEEEEDDDDEDEGDIELKLDVSDDELEDEADDEEEIVAKPEKKKEKAVEKTDKGIFKEPSVVKVAEKPFSVFGRQNTGTSSQFQSAQKASGVLAPIEDSQDLYGTIPDIAITQSNNSNMDSSQDFKFLIEDSQSNMLDADGYLRTETSKQSTDSPIEKDIFPSTQGNMDELLGLCSGRFVASQKASGTSGSKAGLFEDKMGASQKNMDELMGLCSGVFVEEPPVASQNKGVKRKISKEESDEESLTALSDDEGPVSKDKDNDDEEEEEGGDTDQVDSEAEEETMEEKRQKFAGFTVGNKHGKIRRDFVEEEAELSGSEYDSDENLDLPEEEDIMEMEEGDRDAANMDQDKLRDEVGRVHLKRLIDEDKRELLRFQEMYLPDGDLHSEGGGRVRRFKWSNMDDNSHPDMFDGSDNEHETEEVDDAEWRKERYEREKFLMEQQEKEQEKDNDKSQFLQLGKVFLKKRGSADSIALEKQQSMEKSKPSTGSETPGFPASFYKLPQQKRGSFLARSKEALAKIAEMTKPTVNPSAGAKSSGKFTFSVISPEKGKDKEDTPNGKKRTAHVPSKKTLDKGVKKPPLKKPKLDTHCSMNENSIFNHF